MYLMLSVSNIANDAEKHLMVNFFMLKAKI